ncbi:MAG: hypothetical protein HY257_01365 [Chloroflexi bacterium]|nr:hypothetical protein [Chloroflexota bacterium]
MIARFFIYGALGWCGEIIWTALRKKITGVARDWLLMGETSLWAFPLYGSLALWFEPMHDALRDQFFLLRVFAYTVGAWIAEYIGGWLMWKITRVKPWDYSKSPGGSLHGLIRWNFILVYPFVGLAMEKVHDVLSRISLN